MICPLKNGKIKTKTKTPQYLQVICLGIKKLLDSGMITTVLTSWKTTETMSMIVKERSYSVKPSHLRWYFSSLRPPPHHLLELTIWAKGFNFVSLKWETLSLHNMYRPLWIFLRGRRWVRGAGAVKLVAGWGQRAFWNTTEVNTKRGQKGG